MLCLMKRVWVAIILLLAFAGLADSAYLVENELSGAPLLCNIQNLSGCNIVASSQYSRIFGIPLAELGVLFYGIVFILAALELVFFDQLLRRVLQALALIGALASVYFGFVQFFFIGAFCIYCSISALITLLILIFASLIEPIRKKNFPPAPPKATQDTAHLPMPPVA